MNKKENLKTLFNFGGNAKKIKFWYILRFLPNILIFSGPSGSSAWDGIFSPFCGWSLCGS